MVGKKTVNQTRGRAAFTLIELIFAMVVISVSVMSLPMMTQVNSEGIEGNLVQEAIFASVSEINVATSGMWDDESIGGILCSSLLSNVVNTSNSTCTGVGAIIKRPGHVNRKCLDADINTNITTAAQTNVCDSSLEFFKHDYANIYIDNTDDSQGATSAAGYKVKYMSKLEVNLCSTDTHIQFGNTADNPDMKEIVVTIANEDNETVTLLRTYATNIGEVDYARKPL